MQACLRKVGFSSWSVLAKLRCLEFRRDGLACHFLLLELARLRGRQCLGLFQQRLLLELEYLLLQLVQKSLVRLGLLSGFLLKLLQLLLSLLKEVLLARRGPIGNHRVSLDNFTLSQRIETP